MSAEFPYDVFLSHSSKDKAVVCPLRQIIFEGERFDAMSVRRWHEKVLSEV